MINKTELHNIFQKLREGDNSQFELLYKNYNQLVYKISFSILKNKESSEDVTQNIFAKIYSLKKDKLPTSKEATWLYTITKNEAISYYRKEKTNVTLEEIYEVKEAECKELQNIIDKEKYEKLISGLSVKEKEVISLKILGELSFKEIAKILNEPIGTVQWRYYKALNSLQLLLGNISMLFATLALYIGCMRKNKHGIEVPAINNDSKENSQVHEGNNSQTTENSNSHTLEDSKVNTEENTNLQTSQKSKLNNIENTMQGDNVNNQIANEVNDMQNGNTLENNTINILEIPANNEKIYNVTNNILLSLSSIFLVLTVIFAIICIKHQQNKRIR
mgnify:CR=1 FL=1